jgi:hypothetical protein
VSSQFGFIGSVVLKKLLLRGLCCGFQHVRVTLKPRTDEEFFLDTFYLTRGLVQNVVMPNFEPGKLVKEKLLVCAGKDATI